MVTRPRDLPFVPYDQIQLFEGLTAATIDALPAALAAYADEAAADLRLPGRRPDPAACFERLPDGAAPVELATRARLRSASAPASFPFTITASGSRVAISVPHRLMDGGGLVALLRSVIGRAADDPVELDTTTPVARPYWTMVRTHLTRDLLGRFRSERSPVGTGPTIPVPTAADLSRRTARFVAVRLDPADLVRLAASEVRGTSVGMRAGSLALGALARVYSGDADLPVEIPIDLRRFAPRGRIAGNFVTVGALGSLLAGDWSAKAIGTALTAEVRSKRPIARSALRTASAVVHLPKDRLLARRRSTPIGSPAVSLSMLAGPADFPDAAWLPGADRTTGTAVIGPAWPSSTFVLVLQLGPTIRISVWDESGLFDLDALPAAMQQELATREGIRATLV